MGLHEFIDQAVLGEWSGSSILEDIICGPTERTPVLGVLEIHDSVTIACWYVWWQRREIVKGEKVEDPVERHLRSTFDN
jgi:hypothetical protein